MSVSNPVINYIDGPTRRIYLLDGVSSFHPVDDIYTEVRYRRRTIENLRKFDMFCAAGGRVQRIGNSYTPRYLRLLKGTKIVAGAGVDTISITGDIFTDDENDTAIFDNTLLAPGRKIFYNFTPPEAELLVLEVDSGGTGGGSTLTPQQIRNAMLLAGIGSAAPSSIDGQLSQLGTTINNLTTLLGAVDSQLAELIALSGYDPTNPMTLTTDGTGNLTQRVAAGIIINYLRSGNSITATRE